ncbi:MAG: hypothetical protein HYW49_00190 [Deltaproteobacteria bacterium]|nr:hypothetical protein [Deltaproteobacteria bacterium]
MLKPNNLTLAHRRQSQVKARSRGFPIHPLQREALEKVHPLYRVDPKTGTKELITAPLKSLTRTPQPGTDEIKRWERATTYYPTHNGVASPVLAHLANAYPFTVMQARINNGMTHLKYVSSDEKTAFRAARRVKFPKKSLHLRVRGLTAKKIERRGNALVAKPLDSRPP